MNNRIVVPIKRFFIDMTPLKWFNEVMCVFLVAMISWNMLDPYPQENHDYNKLLILIGVFFMSLLLLAAYRWLQKASQKLQMLFSAGCFALLLCGQVVYLCLCKSITYYDYTQMYSNAIAINQTGQVANTHLYNDLWPFFLPPTLIIRQLLLFADMLHLPYRLVINIVNQLCIDGAILILFRLIKKRISLCVASMLAMLCAMNPVLYMRTAYFYTDSMVFPVICLILSLGDALINRMPEKRYRRVLLLTAFVLTATVAYKIRATAIIMLAAVLLYMLFSGRVKLFLTDAAFLACVFAVLSVAYKPIENEYLDLTRTASVGAYLVMGSYMPGVGAGDQTYYQIMGLPTDEARNEKAKEILQQRIDEYGLGGFVNLFYLKIRKLWTVALGGAAFGTYQQEEYNYPFYSFVFGDRSRLLQYYGQMYKSALYLLCAFACAAVKKDCRQRSLYQCTNLFLFGFTLFYMVWHNESRMYYLMIPALLLNAAAGLEYCGALLQKNKVLEKGTVPHRSGEKCAPERVLSRAVTLCVVIALVHGICVEKNLVHDDMTHTKYSVFQERSGGSGYQDIIGEILPGDSVEQTFRTKNAFNTIGIGFKTYGRKSSVEYRVDLITVANSLTLHSWTVSPSELDKDGRINLTLEAPELPEEEKGYLVRITSEQSAIGNALGINAFSIVNYDVMPSGCLLHNNKEIPFTDMQLWVYHTAKYPFFTLPQYTVFVILLLVVMCLIWLFFRMQYFSRGPDIPSRLKKTTRR